jgi:hypothetical protein
MTQSASTSGLSWTRKNELKEKWALQNLLSFIRGPAGKKVIPVEVPIPPDTLTELVHYFDNDWLKALTFLETLIVCEVTIRDASELLERAVLHSFKLAERAIMVHPVVDKTLALAQAAHTVPVITTTL